MRATFVVTMFSMVPADPHPQTPAPPDWFRPPTPREHAIAAVLFVGFGVFFLALFVVTHGWWFRWVIVGLGVYSILHGAGHARGYLRRRGE